MPRLGDWRVEPLHSIATLALKKENKDETELPTVCTAVRSEAADFRRAAQRRSLVILGHTGRTLTHRQQWSGLASWSCCSAARLRGPVPIVSASPSDVLVCKGDDLAAGPETLLLLSAGRGGKETEPGPAQGTGNTATGSRCHGHPSRSDNSPPHQLPHPRLRCRIRSEMDDTPAGCVRAAADTLSPLSPHPIVVSQRNVCKKHLCGESRWS